MANVKMIFNTNHMTGGKTFFQAGKIVSADESFIDAGLARKATSEDEAQARAREAAMKKAEKAENA